MPDEKSQHGPKFVRFDADDLRDYVDKMLEHLVKKHLAKRPTEEKATHTKEER